MATGKKPAAPPAAAKKSTAPAKPGTAVAKVAPQSTGLVLADMDAAELLQDAQSEQLHFGKEDLSIPFLRVLQKGSPQVNKRDPLYVEGAEAGMFFNTLTKELWDGENEGVVVVVSAYAPSYTEWWPRDSKEGKGIVADHGADASCLQGTHRNDKGKDETPRGTEITKAGLYHLVIVDPETGDTQQVALPLSGTQLKKSRQWNSLIGGLLVPHPNGTGKFRPAPFYMSWLLKTVYESNDQGDWFGVTVEQYKPTLELPNGPAIYREAKAFKQLVSSGSVTTRMDQMVDAVVEEAGDAGEQEF